ncbi:putative phytol kinase, chloroplastic [Iris pallida]|uniref:phytol kinase n=1 Tax=Iris pallida TaxID=29817 RepID=A0AAX6EFQ3_IRIPA|nr:putative phytol kinase, chloroplastic [Iris pallida]
MSTAASTVQDGAAAAAAMVGAYFLILLFDSLTDRKLIEQSLSRKVVHVLSGLLFMCSWPFFSSSPEARYFAAIVPLVNCMTLIGYGLRLVTDDGLVKSITREGKPEELLRGPLYYVLVLMFCVLVFWRDSPVGILVLAMMSGGDGFADIMGRRYGSLKLPHNRQKSWVGSISMFISGFLSSVGMLYYYSAFGYLYLDLGNVVGKVALVSLVATVVESLPITETIDDNISVPLSTMLVAMYVFGHVPPR